MICCPLSFWGWIWQVANSNIIATLKLKKIYKEILLVGTLWLCLIECVWHQASTWPKRPSIDETRSLLNFQVILSCKSRSVSTHGKENCWWVPVQYIEMNVSGKKRRRWRDKDNRGVRGEAGESVMTVALHLAAVARGQGHTQKQTQTHTCMQTPNPPQVHSWLRQSGGRETEDKKTHIHTHTQYYV